MNTPSEKSEEEFNLVRTEFPELFEDFLKEEALKQAERTENPEIPTNTFAQTEEYLRSEFPNLTKLEVFEKAQEIEKRFQR